MFNFSDYIIPFWHPLVVHVPIVLIPLALLAVSIWVLKKDELWRRIALFLYAISLVFSYFSYESGETLEHENEGEAQVELFVHDHEKGAKVVLALSLAALALLGVAEIRQRQQKSVPKFFPILVLIIGLLNFMAVAYTGHLGGLMKWGIPG